MHFDDKHSEDPWENAIQSRNVPSKTDHAISSAFYNSPNKSPCSPSLHYSSLAVLSFFAHSRTHNARGHCVCADISWFSALPGAHWGVRREDDKEKETVRKREREQSHPPKTLNWLRAWMLASICCPWMSAHPPLLCSAISLSGSLWVLPVEEKCLWCLITTWHCRTSDCSFQLSSWVTVFLPASYSWAGGADSIIQQQGWVDSFSGFLPAIFNLIISV